MNEYVLYPRRSKTTINVVKDHRANADRIMQEILDEAEVVAENLGIDLELPRIVGRQQHRSNQPSSNPVEYWKRSLLIPYYDSLINSLDDRFSDNNSPAYSLLLLHPSNLLGKSNEELKPKIKELSDFYNMENLKNEIEIWRSHWEEKKLSDEQLKNLDLCDVINETEMFFPSVKHALQISLAQPSTTCTIERSFSTLRRVKTWLRSTMGDNRLSGMHKKKYQKFS